jgi:hypothetical protein
MSHPPAGQGARLGARGRIAIHPMVAPALPALPAAGRR